MTPEEKLSAALAELAEVNRQHAANLRSIRQTQTIHDMVAGITPCAPVRHEPTANEWQRFLNDTLGEYDHDEEEANR